MRFSRLFFHFLLSATVEAGPLRGPLLHPGGIRHRQYDNSSSTSSSESTSIVSATAAQLGSSAVDITTASFPGFVGATAQETVQTSTDVAPAYSPVAAAGASLASGDTPRQQSGPPPSGQAQAVASTLASTTSTAAGASPDVNAAPSNQPTGHSAVRHASQTLGSAPTGRPVTVSSASSTGSQTTIEDPGSGTLVSFDITGSSTASTTNKKTPTGTPDDFIPTAVITSPVPTGTATVSNSQYASNLAEAIRLNAAFTEISADSACSPGQYACVDAEYAHCSADGSWDIVGCSESTVCAAMPLNTTGGVSLRCFPQETVVEVLGAVPEGSADSGSASGSGSATSVTETTTDSGTSSSEQTTSTNKSAGGGFTTVTVPSLTVTATEEGSVESGSSTIRITTTVRSTLSSETTSSSLSEETSTETSTRTSTLSSDTTHQSDQEFTSTSTSRRTSTSITTVQTTPVFEPFPTPDADPPDADPSDSSTSSSTAESLLVIPVPITSSKSSEDAPAPTDTGFGLGFPGIFGGGDDGEDKDHDHKGNNFVGNSVGGGGTSTSTSVDGVTTTVFVTVTSVSTARETETETLIKWATMTIRE